MAERLGTGLQNLLQRFDSARHLFKTPSRLLWRGSSYKLDTELILKFGSASFCAICSKDYPPSLLQPRVSSSGSAIYDNPYLGVRIAHKTQKNACRAPIFRIDEYVFPGRTEAQGKSFFYENLPVATKIAANPLDNAS